MEETGGRVWNISLVLDNNEKYKSWRGKFHTVRPLPETGTNNIKMTLCHCWPNRLLCRINLSSQI
jgi:hypothetical protein